MTAPMTNPEGAFVGAVLHLPVDAAVRVLDLIHDDDFGDPRLAVVAGAARQLAGLGIPPDPAAVLAFIRASGTVTGPSAVTALSLLLADLYGGCPTPASARFYATAVLEEALRRRCAELADRIGQAADSASLDVLPELVATEAREVLALDQRRAGAAGEPPLLRAVSA